MRPAIDISYVKNAKVKTLARKRDLKLPEMYEEIIDAGLDVINAVDSVDWERIQSERELTDAEINAVRAVHSVIVRRGAVTKTEIIEHAWADHDAGKSKEWWWRDLVRPVIVEEEIADEVSQGVFRATTVNNRTQPGSG